MSDEYREEYIANRLAELREAMAGEDCPNRVRPAVMQAFRKTRPRPGPTAAPLYRWGALAAGVAFAVLALYWLSAPRNVIGPPPIAARTPSAPDITPIPGMRPEPVRRVASNKARRPVTAPVARRSKPDNELATDFLALPFAPPMDAHDGGEIVRVTLPRSAMRTVGLPVPEGRWYERVPADVVLGQDGVARAVRFVKFGQ